MFALNCLNTSCKKYYSRAMSAPSLAEKLAALTNSVPQFGDLEDEDNDLVTGAKVTDGDLEDEDDIEERSHLRTVTAGGLDEDERYKGKRFSRKELDKDRDFMEHTGAELGHMFDIGDEEDSNDDDVEEEAEMYEDAESDMEAEDEEESEGESVDMNAGDASVSDDDTIVKVGETDSTYSKGLAVVSQLATWDKLLEERILLQKMLTKVNTFPQDLDQFMEPEDKEHKDLVRQASKSLTKLVQKSVQFKNCVERKGVEDYEVVGTELKDIDEWLESTAKAAEDDRRDNIVRWSERTQRVWAMCSMNTPELE